MWQGCRMLYLQGTFGTSSFMIGQDLVCTELWGVNFTRVTNCATTALNMFSVTHTLILWTGLLSCVLSCILTGDTRGRITHHAFFGGTGALRHLHIQCTSQRHISMSVSNKLAFLEADI